MEMAKEWVCHDCGLLCQISHFYLVLSPVFWLIATCYRNCHFVLLKGVWGKDYLSLMGIQAT